MSDLSDAVDDAIGDSVNVCLGPVVWRDDDGPREWYFIVASGKTEFHADQFKFGEDKEMAESTRASFVAIILRKPVVLHDLGDELGMARLCALIWPCDRTRAILTAVLREAAYVS